MHVNPAAPLVFGLLAILVHCAAVAADWMTHRDPSGFSLEVPRGWLVQAERVTDIAVGDPQARLVALVRARPVHGDFARWLTEEYPRTEPACGRSVSNGRSRPAARM